MQNNDNIEITLSKKHLKVYSKCEKKAKKIIPDKAAVSRTIRKARKIIERLKNIPKLEGLTANICNFCDLLADYFDGIYTNPPLSTVVTLVGGLLYLILPFDVISDLIPALGWIDDTAVVAVILKTEQREVGEYLKWKESQQSKNEG